MLFSINEGQNSQCLGFQTAVYYTKNNCFVLFFIYTLITDSMDFKNDFFYLTILCLYVCVKCVCGGCVCRCTGSPEEGVDPWIAVNYVEVGAGN